MTSTYVLVQRIGAPASYFWKEMGMHLVLENGNQQYYKRPCYLPTSSCGDNILIVFAR